MAIKTLADPTIAYQIANEDEPADGYITVFGGGTVFVGFHKEELEMAEGGTTQGMQYTATNTSGASAPQRIHWNGGAVYARSSTGKQQIDFSVSAKRKNLLSVQRSRRG